MILINISLLQITCFRAIPNKFTPTYEKNKPLNFIRITGLLYTGNDSKSTCNRKGLKMLHKKIEAISARIQFKEYKQKGNPDPAGEILRFKGADGYDVYNPSVPFHINGRMIIAGRVENRANEESDTMFFEKDGETWNLITDAPVLKNLQDPFVTFIDGQLWLGGVCVEWVDGKLILYYTQFYKGSDIYDLEKVTRGPDFMKDIRLHQMADGRIAVFTRPQGQLMLDRYGCIAKIGFAAAENTDQINETFIESAPLLDGQFIPEEWGGANQIYTLKNGLLGIIGHKSWGETIDGVFIIHYYSMAFALNPETTEVTQTKIISDRGRFPHGPQKNQRTADVTFTSGIIRLPDGKCELYTGLNDCEVGRIILDDPLCEYELL